MESGTATNGFLLTKTEIKYLKPKTMKKYFNITGICISQKHFVVDTSAKIEKMLELIDDQKYFTINRPRQFGKTTTFLNIENKLRQREDYICLSISFEGMGVESYNGAELFIPHFLKLLHKIFVFNKLTLYAEFIFKNKNIFTWQELDDLITNLCLLSDKKLVLLIDEVDKSMNNQLFLDFLGILRNKYLLREASKDVTFHSVILAGVHDVKTLKLKISPNSESKYNSPWNIAAEFEIDLSFTPHEIQEMLTDYKNYKNIDLNAEEISTRIYYYTSGYPFLVSKICKDIDEKILPKREEKKWFVSDIEKVIKLLIQENNTNFESLIKNIENNEILYKMMQNIILGGKNYNFVISEPTISMAYMYGIIDKNHETGKIKIHNKIYEEYITDYYIAKYELYNDHKISNTEAVQSTYITDTGKLDFDKVLLKFQEVIKEKYSKSDVLKSDEFLEKDLRLLFLVFLKPIINGIGFSFKEVETSEEKRLDIVVIFADEKFITELKIWRGQEYHQQGILRLKDYMRRENANKSYMLIMDKNRHKQFTTTTENEIKMIWI